MFACSSLLGDLRDGLREGDCCEFRDLFGDCLPIEVLLCEDSVCFGRGEWVSVSSCLGFGANRLNGIGLVGESLATG